MSLAALQSYSEHNRRRQWPQLSAWETAVVTVQVLHYFSSCVLRRLILCWKVSSVFQLFWHRKSTISWVKQTVSPDSGCGSFVASPHGKSRLHTLWKSFTSSLARSRASSNYPRFDSFKGNLWSDTLLSFCITAHNTLHNDWESRRCFACHELTRSYN